MKYLSDFNHIHFYKSSKQFFNWISGTEERLVHNSASLMNTVKKKKVADWLVPKITQACMSIKSAQNSAQANFYPQKKTHDPNCSYSNEKQNSRFWNLRDRGQDSSQCPHGFGSNFSVRVTEKVQLQKQTGQLQNTPWSWCTFLNLWQIPRLLWVWGNLGTTETEK